MPDLIEAVVLVECDANMNIIGFDPMRTGAAGITISNAAGDPYGPEGNQGPWVNLQVDAATPGSNNVNYDLLTFCAPQQLDYAVDTFKILGLCVITDEALVRPRANDNEWPAPMFQEIEVWLSGQPGPSYFSAVTTSLDSRGPNDSQNWHNFTMIYATRPNTSSEFTLKVWDPRIRDQN